MKRTTKRNNQTIVKVCLNIIFHYYRNHKDELTALRIWFVSRYLIDAFGAGWVKIDEASKIVKIKPENIRRKCNHSGLFSGLSTDRLYYKSLTALLKKHKLTLRVKLRGEKVTKVFAKQFKIKKTFLGYICKCYIEQDLDPRPKIKKRYTRGRISYLAVADYFRISRKTAITNIQNSNAKPHENRRRFYNIKFSKPSDIGNWLLNNMDKVLDGRRVEKNPNSYQVERKGNKYILVQDLPNIYKFTGVFLESRRIEGQCSK